MARASSNDVILDALLLRLNTETAGRRGATLALRVADLCTEFVGCGTRPVALDQCLGLVDANLLTELERERYRFHDLVRLYAVERAEIEETATDRSVERRSG